MKKRQRDQIKKKSKYSTKRTGTALLALTVCAASMSGAASASDSTETLYSLPTFLEESGLRTAAEESEKGTTAPFGIELPIQFMGTGSDADKPDQETEYRTEPETESETETEPETEPHLSEEMIRSLIHTLAQQPEGWLYPMTLTTETSNDQSEVTGANGKADETETLTEIVSEAETMAEIAGESETMAEVAGETETMTETAGEAENMTETAGESETMVETAGESGTMTETMAESANESETMVETAGEAETVAENASEPETVGESENGMVPAIEDSAEESNIWASRIREKIAGLTGKDSEESSETMSGSAEEIETESGSAGAIETESESAGAIETESESAEATETESESTEEVETESESAGEVEAESESAGEVEAESESAGAIEKESGFTEEVETESESMEASETEAESTDASETETENTAAPNPRPIRELFELRDYRQLHGYRPVRLHGEISWQEYVGTRPLKLLCPELKRMISEFDGDWSVYLKKLNTEDTLTLNDRPMKSASVMKLFVMGTVYRAIEKGELNRTDEIMSWMENMITVSDNDSTNRLLYELGSGSYERGIVKVNEFIKANGYSTDTIEYNGFNNSETVFDADHFNQVTAADCGKLLEDIYHRTLFSWSISNEIEQMMLNQHTRYKIPAGLPDDVRCGNKTGEMDTTENDAAIVYAKSGDYILIVLSSDWENKDQAISHIADVSKTVYNYLN